jgi:hypothetical protein
MAKKITFGSIILILGFLIGFIVLPGFINKFGFANDQLNIRNDSAFFTTHMDIDGGLGFNQQFALLYFDTTITIDLTVNEYTIITDSENSLYDIAYNYGLTKSNDTLSEAIEGLYYVRWNFSAEGSVGSVFESRLNNSVLFDGAMPVSIPVINNLVTIPGEAIIYLEPGEKFCIDIRNTQNSTDITLKKGYIFIRKLLRR